MSRLGNEQKKLNEMNENENENENIDTAPECYDLTVILSKQIHVNFKGS